MYQPIHARNKDGNVDQKQDLLIKTGSYVRVHAPSKAIKWTSRGKPLPLKGMLVALYEDSLILEGNDFSGRLSLPLDNMEKLEISVGKRGHKTWLGGGIGFLVGALTALVFGTTKGGDDPATALITMGIGGGAGFVLGFTIGLGITAEKWEEIPIDRIKIDHSLLLDDRVGSEVSFTF